MNNDRVPLDGKWTVQDLTEAISGMYRSEEYQDLIVRNRERTFMQMIGCERVETAHSAFLAEIFGTKPCSRGNPDSPLLYFLRLLAYKAKEQSGQGSGGMDGLMPEALWRNIVINNCSVEVAGVYTEVPVVLETDCGRIDIMINCDIRCLDCQVSQKLHIVIENKIDSKEGDGQCRKYYEATENEKGTYIYVFLSPSVPEQISSPNFIKITYTDLLHNVFKVVLKQRALYDDNLINALEQYIKTITSPLNSPMIAMDEDFIKLAKQFFQKNKELIRQIAFVINDEDTRNSVQKALNHKPGYVVTYKNASYPKPTKLNKLAYQIVYLFERSGMDYKKIEGMFCKIRPNGFLLKKASSAYEGEKISIKGTDYWVPTKIWASDSHYVRKLFEMLRSNPDLSYEELD